MEVNKPNIFLFTYGLSDYWLLFLLSPFVVHLMWHRICVSVQGIVHSINKKCYSVIINVKWNKYQFTNWVNILETKSRFPVALTKINKYYSNIFEWCNSKLLYILFLFAIGQTKNTYVFPLKWKKNHRTHTIDANMAYASVFDNNDKHIS